MLHVACWTCSDPPSPSSFSRCLASIGVDVGGPLLDPALGEFVVIQVLGLVRFARLRAPDCSRWIFAVLANRTSR